MTRVSATVLFLLCTASCGGRSTSPIAADVPPATSEPDDASNETSVSSAQQTGEGPSSLGFKTCEEAGCQTAFRCTACGPTLVCDDIHGDAACVTLETFFECGEGTFFCNSSCGVCLLPGSPCVKDSCDEAVKTCGQGARCGSGTRCVDDVCVLDQ